MTRRRRVRSGVAWVGALALALLGCSPGSDRGSENDLPDFTLPDLDGQPVTLSDFRGKTVLLDFWATWCPPCLEQVPRLNEFWRTHRDGGQVVVIGVAVDVEGAEVVGPWVAEHQVEYTIVIGDEAVARSFGTIGFPTLAVIAPDGQVDSLHVGLIEISELEEIVASVRAHRSI